MSEAAAHEFRLVALGAVSGPSADARLGLRLAIDASPDVGHPPGPDAGDHLGGLDVELVWVDSAGPDPLAAATEARGAVIVVLDPAADLTVLRSRPTDAPVIAVVDGDKAPTGVVVALRTGMPARPSRASQEFDAAFNAEHERPPTPAAAWGYDAGRLLDAWIAESGGAPDWIRLGADAPRLEISLVGTSLVAGEPLRPAGQASSDGGGNVAWIVAAATLTAGGLAWMLRRRRTRRGGRGAARTRTTK